MVGLLVILYCLLEEYMKLTGYDIEALRGVICEASDAVMEIYSSGDFAVEKKADRSLLTRADLKASEIVEKGLEEHFPDIPVLGEEWDHWNNAQRQDWDIFWTVDPIDGTQEFVEQNDQFVINIALIKERKPVFWMMIHPPSGLIYRWWKEYGAWRAEWMGERVSLQTIRNQQKNTQHTKRPFRVFIDQWSAYPLDARFIDFLKKKDYTVEIAYVWSAWKFCQLAEWVVDCYPRFRWSMWRDIAAWQALVEGLGFMTIPVDTAVGTESAGTSTGAAVDSSFDTATDADTTVDTASAAWVVPVTFGPADPMRYETETMVNSSFVVIDPEVYEDWVGETF